MDVPDLITNEWFLVSSWRLPIFILGLYLWFVLKAGPHFMKGRKPFVLKKTIIIYNLIMVAFNFCLMLEGWSIVSTYDLTCQTTDYSTSPMALKTRNMVWYVYVSKYIDLLETVFFVLRNKTSQVTFLHVYHHALTPMYALMNIKYQPGGQGVFIGALNTTVHVFMYLYYGIAALGPKYKKFLWWKRHVTELQLIQFIIILLSSGQSYFRNCDYPMWLVHIHMTVAAFFVYLFGNFYYKTYLSTPKITTVQNNL